MIIATITPREAYLPMRFVRSLLDLPHEYRVIFQEGPFIPDNRNSVWETARLVDQDLLFIDSDMTFKVEDVKKMEEHLKTKDVVTGVYGMSWEGNPPAVFDENRDVVIHFPKEPFEIGSCGAGFLGISKGVIQALHQPFELIKHETYGTYFGEDVSFCMRTREAGFKVWCDPSIQLGHIKTEVKYAKIT